jgi:hypothetical protein
MAALYRPQIVRPGLSLWSAAFGPAGWTTGDLDSSGVSAAPGWYPDPGGRRGAFRYWDGRSWSATTQPGPRRPGGRSAESSAPAGSPRRRVGWLVGGVALLVAIVVLGVLAVRFVGGALEVGPFTPGNPSSDVCPPPNPASPSPQPADGRVHGGRLSYPTLGDPWDPPAPESRISFGRGVLRQYEEVERGDYGRYSSWGAAVLVGELVAGDGFFTPRDGAAIVIKCVTGTFYGDTEVTREDYKNTAIKVDGHDAWIIESNLGFDVPNLQAKHELLIVVIVDTRDGAAGLFLASVPENAPQLVAPARQALAQLRVD